MKKLSVIALFSALAISASQASAYQTIYEKDSKFKLELGGEIVAAGVLGDFDDDADGDNGTYQYNPVDTLFYGHLNVKGSTQINSDFSAGVTIKARYGMYEGVLNNEEAFGFMQSKTFGELRVGQMDEVSNDFDRSSVDVSALHYNEKESFFAISMLSDGDMPESTEGLPYTTQLDSLTSYSQYGGISNTGKIAYISPDMMGLKVSLSYIPGAEYPGENTSLAENSEGRQPEFQEAYTVGLGFDKKMGNMTLGLSGAYMKIDDVQYNNSSLGIFGNQEEVSLSAKIGISGFELAAGYRNINAHVDNAEIDIGDSWVARPDSETYSIGAAYSWDKFGLSVSYLETTSDGGDTQDFGTQSEMNAILASFAYAPSDYAKLFVSGLRAKLDANELGTGYYNKTDSVLYTGLAIKF